MCSSAMEQALPTRPPQPNVSVTLSLLNSDDDALHVQSVDLPLLWLLSSCDLSWKGKDLRCHPPAPGTKPGGLAGRAQSDFCYC